MFEYTVYKGSVDGIVYKSTTTRLSLVDDEVLLSITAAGLCGTDNHFRHHDMVLGHEGVGVVEELGPNVRSLRKGDRVGWGYQHSSCGTCQKCLSKDEIFCSDRKIYGESDLDQGAFASQAIWKESFLFKLPDGLTDVEAAPLMCAGSTVYFALKRAGVSIGDRVGVFGLGGLGHLAIQFAVNQGCSVSVFSETEGKADDAKQFGAEEFYLIKDSTKTGYQGELLNTLLVTTSSPADWHYLVSLMAPRGRIFFLSILDQAVEIPSLPLVTQALAIEGSVIAPRCCCEEMLENAVQDGVRPVVHRLPLTADGINKGFDLITLGTVRYRIVLTPED